jgi:transcriptional regulator of arginine metabolism
MHGATKAQRQRAIRQLVAGGAIRTQDDLVEGLAQAGVHATQATISRDVEEMGLLRVRVPGQGTIYALAEAAAPDEAAARRRLRHLLDDLPVETAVPRGFLLVRTAPGSANLLAVALDRCGFPEIVGTVAGDDTILIALRDPGDLERVRAYVTAGAES